MSGVHPNPGGEHDSSGGARLAMAVGVLVVIWFVVYWLTPSEGEEPLRVTFDEPAGGAVVGLTPVEPGVVVEEPGAVDEGVGIIPPEFDEYISKKNDTAWTISEAVYGTPGYARRIMNANPLTDFTRLRRGQKIRVPKDPANVQGLPADGSGETMAPEPAYTEYVVQRNDTLTGIAKALYGKASYWTRIRDANPGKINQGGTNIRPGMTILIPPPPNRR